MMRKIKGYTSQEWEQHKPVITRLYQQEGRTLRELREIMKQEHGVDATDKMYKIRIAKWGLDKKLKSDEVLAILHLKQARDSAGKASAFTIRGTPLDMDNLQRYTRRNPAILAQFQSGTKPNPKAYDQITYRTPSPSPGPFRRFAGAETSDELLLTDLRNYIHGSIDARRWSWDFNQNCTSSRYGASRRLEDFRVAIFDAAECILRGDDSHLIAILNPAFSSIADILRDEDPVMLFSLYRIISFLVSLGQMDYVLQVVKYMSQMSTVLHPTSPLTKILAGLHKLVQEESVHRLASRMVKLTVDSFQQLVGPSNQIGEMVMKQQIILLTYGQEMFLELEPLIDNWVQTAPPLGHEALYLRLYHARADAYREQNKLVKARKELDKAAALIEACPDAWWQNDEKSWHNELASGVEFKCGNFDVAQKLMLKALWYRSAGSFGWGYRHSRLVGQLESMLQAVGDHKKALGVRRIRQRLLRFWIKTDGMAPDHKQTQAFEQNYIVGQPSQLVTGTSSEKGNEAEAEIDGSSEVVQPIPELLEALGLNDLDVFEPGHAYYSIPKANKPNTIHQSSSESLPSDDSSQLTPSSGNSDESDSDPYLTHLANETTSDEFFIPL